MSKKQSFIFYTLLLSGMLLIAAYPIFIKRQNFYLSFTGAGLAALAGMYQIAVWWQNRRYDKLQNLGFRLVVLFLTLFVIYLVWG